MPSENVEQEDEKRMSERLSFEGNVNSDDLTTGRHSLESNVNSDDPTTVAAVAESMVE